MNFTTILMLQTRIPTFPLASYKSSVFIWPPSYTVPFWYLTPWIYGEKHLFLGNKFPEVSGEQELCIQKVWETLLIGMMHSGLPKDKPCRFQFWFYYQHMLIPKLKVQIKTFHQLSTTHQNISDSSNRYFPFFYMYIKEKKNKSIKTCILSKIYYHMKLTTVNGANDAPSCKLAQQPHWYCSWQKGKTY
jgi:hypothetical protein